MIVDTAALPGLSLSALNSVAALQARQDRKYVVSEELLTEVVFELADELAVLELDGRRACTYVTTYYDTPDLLCYRQHVQGVRRRVKARTRTYVDSGLVRLELKAKGPDGHTVKHALDGAATHLDATGRAFLRRALDSTYGPDYAPDLVATLQQVQQMTCDRTTFAGVGEQVRITADTDLRLAGQQLRPGLVLVEVKSAGPRTEVDRALVRRGVRPTSFSKYVAGLELDRSLVDRPRQHSAQLLSRCFTTAPDLAA